MPRTMTAERETEVRNQARGMDLGALVHAALGELDAERAAHLQTTQRVAELEHLMSIWDDREAIQQLKQELAEAKDEKLRCGRCGNTFGHWPDGVVRANRLEAELAQTIQAAEKLVEALGKCNFSLGQAIDRAERHSLVGQGPYTWEDNCADARAALAQYAATKEGK